MKTLKQRNRIITAVTIFFISIIMAGAHAPLSRLDFPINTPEDDFSPSLTPDGNIMVFNSRAAQHREHNIYITKKTNGRWSKPEPIETINSQYNDETPFISADGKSIFFASDRPHPYVEPVESPAKTGRRTFNIYVSELKEGKWSEPAAIPGDVNTDMNERAPSLSIDGNTLFYTRHPYRYIRNSKIMKADFTGGFFANSTELPPPVNTGNMDISIRPALNGFGYYFSSVRKDGFGGWDLYYVEYIDGQWKNLQLLPEPVNSSAHDLFLSETLDNMVYFCSDRIRGAGGYDIYLASKTWDFASIKAPPPPPKDAPPQPERIELPAEIAELPEKPEEPAEPGFETAEPETEIAGIEIAEQAYPEYRLEDEDFIKESYHLHIKPEDPEEPGEPRTKILITVINVNDRKPMETELIIAIKDTDDPSVPELDILRQKTESDGTTAIYPEDDSVEWLIITHSDPDYKPVELAVRVVPDKTLETTLILYPVSIKDRKPAPAKRMISPAITPVYFDYNAWDLKISYYPYLHGIVRIMREDPSRKILLVGHADKSGSRTKNFQISSRRIEEIVKYFKEMGIDEKRIITRNRGCSEARHHEGPEMDQADRRVDIYYIR